MKKITIGALMLSTVFAVAQHSIQKIESPVLKGLTPLKGYTPNNVNEKNKNALLSASFHYVLSFGVARAQFEIDVNNVPPTEFSYYAQAQFMDSTARSSNSTETSYISENRAGVVIDPTSPYYDPNQSGTPLLSRAVPYTLDTVTIHGLYQVRNNISDTLLIEICWADTTGQTTFQALNAGGTKTWLMPYVNSSSSNGNKSFLTAPANHRLRIKRVLTSADTSGNHYFDIPVMQYNGNVPLVIPAGNVFSISYVFVPGQAYAFGDVSYQYQNPTDPATQNGFAQVMLGEVAATPVGYLNDLDNKYNAHAWFFKYGRYGQYTNAILNNCMLPDLSSGYMYDIFATISSVATGVKENADGTLKVYQNTPNPANNSTIVNYDLKNNSQVTLDVFDMTGKRISTINEGTQFSGNHSIVVNTESLQGGVYFYTLTSGDSKVTKRFTVVK